MRSRFIIIRRYDDTGHEAVAHQTDSESRARCLAADWNRQAAACGSATTYRVITEIRRPRLAGWRKVPA